LEIKEKSFRRFSALNGAIVRDPGRKIAGALVYPDTRAVVMSNIRLQTIPRPATGR
jgi:hypothetical protein